jgi:nicotinate-nucleotide pyrophosphorylase (carboxylating)
MNDFEKYLTNFIENAIAEDLGDGDHSSLSCIPRSAKGKAQLIVKQKGIIAGVDIAKHIFTKINSNLQVDIYIQDGTKIYPGDIAFLVEGEVHAILQAERLVLNVMQRMSGIATETNRYVEKLRGLKTKVLDTRKTTPGLRLLEKYAVKIGGGENHRMGLYDMIMIKDNHVDFAGGIEQAINAANNYLVRNNKTLKIEIEARNIEEIKTILSIGKINRIMLDNFSIDETHEAVKLIGNDYETESSGGIDLNTIRDYAECGVDYISVGALTHQIKSLDMSLKAV